jgi:hypothetical protein
MIYRVESFKEEPFYVEASSILHIVETLSEMYNTELLGNFSEDNVWQITGVHTAGFFHKPIIFNFIVREIIPCHISAMPNYYEKDNQ